MRRYLGFGLILAGLLCGGGAGRGMAQGITGASAGGHAVETVAETRPTVTFTFERVGVPVPSFSLSVDDEGNGRYKGEDAPTAERYASMQPTPMAFDRRFTITAATTRRIFGLTRELHDFNERCASKEKNIASTGKKTLRYAGPDGTGMCAYDYSENKYVGQLTPLLEGIAETMDKGRELDQLHRYDRLGLDAALDYLAREVAEGQALELGTIAGSLRSLAGDTALMERVQARARAMLASLPENKAEAVPGTR